MATDFQVLIDELVRLKPESRNAERVRGAAEHELMKAISSGGQRAAARAMASLNAAGHAFVPVKEPGSLRTWREVVAGTPRVLEVTTHVTRHFRSSHVKYHIVRELRLTKRQLETHQIQEAFYARFGHAAQKAYRGAGYRALRPADRLIVLIGELEADVNNGGFEQYLNNKGRRRARAALKVLRTIGASITERMLALALQSTASPTQLQRLDQRFYKVPDDLAMLAMQHLAKQRERGASR